MVTEVHTDAVVPYQTHMRKKKKSKEMKKILLFFKRPLFRILHLLLYPEDLHSYAWVVITVVWSGAEKVKQRRCRQAADPLNGKIQAAISIRVCEKWNLPSDTKNSVKSFKVNYRRRNPSQAAEVIWFGMCLKKSSMGSEHVSPLSNCRIWTVWMIIL